MPVSSAPWVLPFAGWLWPAGPERVTVEARELLPHQRSRVTDPERGLTLLVDPSLPPPARHEGPLGCEAQALRQARPPKAIELVSRGPRPPIPGADPARAAAVRCALEAVFGDALAPSSELQPLELDVARSGRPWSQEGNPGLGPPDRELLALLDDRLVLHEDRVSGLRGEPATAPGSPIPFGRLAAWLESARGQGLGAPTRSPRACELERALASAGMIARWPLGSGVVLVLCEPGARGALVEALLAHGLPELPLRLSGVSGLRLEEKEAA